MSRPGVQARSSTSPGGPANLLPETWPALEPLRAALRSQARSEAEQIIARAEGDATALLEKARAELAGEVAAARARGEAEARALLRLERGRTQQRSRGLVLSAQREVYDELVTRAEDAVRQLLTDPLVRERLADRLRDRLGVSVVIVDTVDGGLQAQASDGRIVDASVEALVRDTLPRLDLEDLWAAAG